MLIGLDSLDSEFNKKNKEPTNIDFIYYIFFKQGIALNEFVTLPLPYIFSIMSTHSYMQQLEVDAHKKAQRKR